jgi:hypothetical protein
MYVLATVDIEDRTGCEFRTLAYAIVVFRET